MPVDGVQAAAHGHDGHVCPARPLPRVDLGGEFVDLTPGQHHILAAEGFSRPAPLAHQIPDPVPGVGGVVDAAAEEDEAVAEAGCSVECLVAESSEPDGDGQVGFGMRAARSTRSKRPAKSTTGSVNSRRSKSICSSWRAPRVRKSWPRAWYSTGLQPTPTPRRSRPPESRLIHPGFGGGCQGVAPTGRDGAWSA